MQSPEKFAVQLIRNRIHTRLAAMQRDPGNNVLRDIGIADMDAVYDAHAAKKIVDIFDGCAAGQISDLDEHSFDSARLFL